MFINIPIPEIPNIPATSQVSASASGGSSASVNVVNVVNSNSSSGGTQTVHIETTVDGQTHVEDYSKDIPADGSVSYTVATSSTLGSSTASGWVHTTVRTHGSSTVPRVHIFSAASSTHASTSGIELPEIVQPVERNLALRLINRVGNIFSSFFGIFTFSK